MAESADRLRQNGFKKGFHDALSTNRFNLRFSTENPVASLDLPACFGFWCGPRTVLAQHGSRVALAFSTNGCVVDMGERRVLWSIEGHTEILVSAAFSKDGEYLVVGSADRSFTVWYARSGFMAHRQRVQAPVGAVDFSDDGRLLLTGHYNLGEIHVWDTDSFLDDALVQLKTLHGPTLAIGRAAFSSDRKSIVASVKQTGYTSSDAKLCKWNLDTERRRDVECDAISTMAPSQDRTKLLCVYASGKVGVRNAETLQQEVQLEACLDGPDREHQPSPSVAWIGVDLVAVAVHRTLLVWNTATNQYKTFDLSHPAVSVCAYGDDKFMLTGANNQIAFWSVTLMRAAAGAQQ